MILAHEALSNFGFQKGDERKASERLRVKQICDFAKLFKVLPHILLTDAVADPGHKDFAVFLSSFVLALKRVRNVDVDPAVVDEMSGHQNLKFENPSLWEKTLSIVISYLFLDFFLFEVNESESF